MTDSIALCYHALSPGWPATLSVTPERFAAQIGFLAERGYRGVTFSELVAADRGERLVAVTFDDAFQSVLDIGRPILDRFGMPATVFVPTDFPDRTGPLRWPGIDNWLGGPHEPELACMSWEALRGLAGAGWEIGSHTCSHPHLTRIDDAGLARELGDSRAAVADRIGRPCDSVAYPYGDYDERVVAAAAAAGYTTGASLTAWQPQHLPLRWPRVGIYHGDERWRWRLKLSPVLRRVASTPAANTAITIARRAH